MSQPSTHSRVEQIALQRTGAPLRYAPAEKLGVVVVDNFPALGKLTALRFLEWVQENPEGVVSLPTGKTPEHFIKRLNAMSTNARPRFDIFSAELGIRKQTLAASALVDRVLSRCWGLEGESVWPGWHRGLELAHELCRLVEH